MPTTFTWTGGAADGDYTTAANYSPGTGPPADGDSLIFDRGNVNLTVNLDQSAVDLVDLIITPGFTGTLGISAGSPFKIRTTGSYLVQPGSGLDSAGQPNRLFLNSGGTNPIVALDCNPENPQTLIDFGGTITTARLQAGRVTWGASSTTFHTQPRDGNDANLYVTYNGGTITTAHLYGGDGNIAAATTFTTMNHHAGLLWNYKGAITTVNLHKSRPSQQFIHYSTSTITTLTAFMNAFFDGSRDGRAKTITNAIRHAGATIRAGNITLTNGVKNAIGVADTDYMGGGAS